MSKLLNARHHHVLYKDQHSLSSSMKFDNRPTLSRSAAVAVYNGFAEVDHTGGKDVGSGYGGPAISALLDMANFPVFQIILQAQTAMWSTTGLGKAN